MKSNWELSHTSLCVKDSDKDFAPTVQYFRALGLIADLPRTKPAFNPADQMETIIFGQVRPPRDPGAPLFLRLIYIGDLEIELLHSVRAPGEELMVTREGVNHVCFKVPDIDGETDELVEKGFPLVMDARRNGVRVEDYLDTREFGNIYLSLRPFQTEEEDPGKSGYGIIDWKFYGHSAVVRDVDKTAQYYESMGVATVQPEVISDSSLWPDFKVYGQTPRSPIRLKIRTVQIGPVAYEFIQPLEGESIFQEYLDRRGDGIITLTFTVDDLERETAKLVDKGVPVILNAKSRTGRAVAYFDTRENGGDTMIKLVQR